jgi:hypothetical protein
MQKEVDGTASYIRLKASPSSNSHYTKFGHNEEFIQRSKAKE